MLQDEIYACKTRQVPKKSKEWSASIRDQNEIQICIIWGHQGTRQGKGTRQGSVPYTRIFLIGAPIVLKHLKNEAHAWKTRSAWSAWILVINFRCHWKIWAKTVLFLWFRPASRVLHVTQEPRKGGVSKGGLCRTQSRAQENKKYPRILDSRVHLALRALQLEEWKRPPPPRQDSASGLY